MRSVAVVGLLAVGCHHHGGGGVADGAVDGVSSSSADGFNALIRASYCKVMANCSLFTSASVCDSLALQFEPGLDPNVVAAIDAGKVTFDANAAAACAAAIASATCDTTMTEPGRVLPDPCYQIIAGTVAAAGQCAIDEECVSQLCNVTPCTMACCSGTCAPGAAPTRPQLGQSCSGFASSIGGACVNSYCDTSSGTCQPYVALGSACSPNTSVCAVGLGCTNGKCEPLPGPGAACTATPGCLELEDSCNTTSSTCTAYAIAGQACSSTMPCYFLYNCDSTQHCVLRPTLGQACMPMSNYDCIDNSYCNSSTLICTPYAQDGDSCTLSIECASGNCDGATNKCVSSTCI